MAQDLTKKEALFNEVKGSLFEYLVGKELSARGKSELSFQQSIDKNYLTVLSQQDRMVRQFYPEMFPFLNQTSRVTADKIISYLNEVPAGVRVVGKFSQSSISNEIHEADILLTLKDKILPVSLKLNKKNAFVNTKSGGIKSFFTAYFPFISPVIQEKFNSFVDLEFNRMALELHSLHDLEYPGNFSLWVKKGFSELPGELDQASRSILKAYYARIAKEMHLILSQAKEKDPESFVSSLAPLMGFSSKDILQVIFFHEFPEHEAHSLDIHSYQDLAQELSAVTIKEFAEVSSVEVGVGSWDLQIRVKPMNKFTTTAIKINCSVRTKRPSIS